MLLRGSRSLRIMLVLGRSVGVAANSRVGRGVVLPIAIVLMASAAPSVAQAQGKDSAACKAANRLAPISRDAGRLVEARNLLQDCARAACSAAVHKKCAQTLAELEIRIPSVIPSAEDRAGMDLVDVNITIDGKPGPTTCDGAAHEIDPGEHTFVFKLADGRTAQRKITLREGEKNVSVAVTIGAPEVRQPPPAVHHGPAWEHSDAALAAAQPRPRKPSPLRLVGFVAAGVGVAGLAVGTVFGLMSSSKLSAPNCDPSTKLCDPGVIDDAKSAATISTISFVAGGVLVAGGLTLALVAPKGTSSARVNMAPTVGLNSGGLSLLGAW